tara:strand:- start:16 stop:534 length:519 start_codon:yes stop_codon:yes gene_type:complete
MSFKLPHQSSPFTEKESAKEQYESFSRFEKPEVKKFIDSLKTNDPFNKHIDYIYDSESRRAENKYYSEGEVIKSKKSNPIKQKDNSTNERLAEIKATKERMNRENSITDNERAKKRLLKEIPKDMQQQQQMVGTSGSLGLIIGGGAKGLYNIGKYVAKNILKKGAVKGVDKL